MLNINASTLMETRPGTLASGVTACDEGTALVFVLENGVGRFKPSAGVANEVFAGVALGNPAPVTRTNRVEEIVVPAQSPYTITLARAPLANPLVVVKAAGANAKATLAYHASTVSSTQYTISGSTITVDSSFAGRTIRVQYPYAISAAELIQGPYGYDSNRVTDLTSVPAMGVITVGEVFVDNFDPASDWETWGGATPVKLGANGIFTLGGSGVAIDAAVISVPAVGNGFLGLKIPTF